MSADPHTPPESGLARSLRERFVQMGFSTPADEARPGRTLVAARERLTNGIALYLGGNAARRAALVHRLQADVGTLVSAGEVAAVADAAEILAARLGDADDDAGTDPLLDSLLAPIVVEELRRRDSYPWSGPRSGAGTD